MALNRELVGKSYSGSGPWLVDAAHVREYAVATQSDNRRYLDPQTAGGIVAPPIYGVVVGQSAVEQLLLDPELGVDTPRLLHADQQMRFGQPMRAGETLHCAAVVVGIGDKRGGETLDVASRVRGENGRLVYDALVGIFIRADGMRPTGQDRKAAIADVVERVEPPVVARGATPLLERTLLVATDLSLRYAAASGDYNPIHKDAAFARSVGLPGIILHGMCTLAMAHNAVVDGVAAGDPARLRELSARFTRPVMPGDALTVRVFDVATDGELKQVAFEVVNQHRKAVIKDGSASIANG